MPQPSPTPSGLTPDAPTGPDAVTALAAELVRHARLLHVVRAHMATWAPEGLDGAAISLLMQLVKCGPRRQGELADVAILDPSTVSRYVGQLVRRGLAERRPDPVDGRAVQLVATQAGHDAAGRMIDRRNEIFRDVLAGWTTDEVLLLTGLLTRLNDDVESRRHLFSRSGATDVAGPGGPTASPAPLPDAGPAAVRPEENP